MSYITDMNQGSSRYKKIIKFSASSLLVIFILLLRIPVFAQETSGVDARFKLYSAKAVQEKLFLHTDKEFYVAGEILWFRIYYVNGTTHQPMQMSKLSYVEILNSNNEPVLQAKISLQPGSDNGSFYLPATLPTGNYFIRAYTNWMKNFEPDYFFEKKITVVNTLKVPESSLLMDSANDNSIDFFPEGGNLVRGLNSRVAFIISSNKGGVNDAIGYIVDQNNDTVTTFAPLKFGIGHFEFKPGAGNSYRAIITLPGDKTIVRLLPEIFDYGYVMNVKEDEQQFRITVQLKNAPGGASNERLLLLAHTRQQLYVAERLPVSNNDSTVFLLDKNRIGKGVTYLTLFNNDEKPVCERLIYIKPELRMNLSVKPDKEVYEARQKVSLSVNAGQMAYLSASVFVADSLQKGDAPTIVDYMWLSSDIGDVESPAYYFSNDRDVAEATDNLLLTHGWRRFKWDKVLNRGTSFIKYLPEINGHIVTARVRNLKNDSYAANISAFLSVQSYPYGFYNSVSDKNGMLYFEVKDFYGNSQVIAGPGIGEDSVYRVEIVKPYAEAISGKRSQRYLLSSSFADALLQKSIGMQVQNIYMADSLRRFMPANITDTLPFYGTPETSYRLDDYQRFTTMEEVLREYVREIGVGLRNEKLIFKIFDPMAHDFYTNNSLVLLDGVPLSDPNKIFSYDPLKVRKLDVIRSRYVIGHLSYNGIASFVTYGGVFDGYDLDPKLVAVDYSGLQLQREFYSPRYETAAQIQSRLPDFRTTLLWAPDIVTDKDGMATINFYCSDLHGKYRIVMQGLNEKGDFVVANSTIEVK